MAVCPICDADDYDRDKGCQVCGHYDEDRVRLRRRERRRREDRQRRGRRKSL